MNKFKTTIGLEIHLELNTKTKLFSPTPINFHSNPNTLVHPIDLGYPGTLPSLNRQVVIKAIKLAKALNMTINDYLIFDRKHYFYPDLPKGYQITQYHNPIAKNGYLELENNKIIRIKQIHIEEDTAKSIHKNNKWYLDFNRA
ncbi:MAG: Asp-tRNA(Asn)/Glu-tRNA(Gln) amidotransferase GatCAB subunit B, partial [Mycoplasma sp.]|nr:Asp-tRNA(Asn)/Glu-tRNA(Gln) amidotransferase GatCAB subunit B [Mycoplasma sp.]